MAYTIKQAAEKTNLTAHTLRYYDKEGLLPFVERSNSGFRRFTDNDLEWLSVICCLKATGMAVKQIKVYIDLCMQGDATIEARRQIFTEHRHNVVRQIEDLQKHLAKVDFKLHHYDEICARRRFGNSRPKERNGIITGDQE